MMESNYLTWLSITNAQAFSRGVERLACLAMSAVQRVLEPFHILIPDSLVACSGPVAPSIKSKGRVISIPVYHLVWADPRGGMRNQSVGAEIGG